MKIPERLNSLLARDIGLNAFALQAISTIAPWAQENKTVFFPEYTDHSLVHMAEVLQTADSLISDQSWPHLTSEDAAVLIISILLHDCALHISEDGFFSLIEGTYKANQSRYIKDHTDWKALWSAYIVEARRFDQRKLVSLFGSPEPVGIFPTDKLNLTRRHNLLVGEFLRRHHARLAHEIAIAGIPGTGAPLSIGGEQYKNLLDLAGYVARSHNLSIRSAVDGLEPTTRRVHLNCRVPFVMVILRISDYIQIHSSRAPGQLLRLKSLSSPVSRGEWSKHASVREINQAHDDPEAIFVQCEPENVATFLGMQRLLKDIQSELDHSWAVMGEVYGRLEQYNDLGVTVRRIRSNIDDPSKFKNTPGIKYIPKEFKFKTASAELMDLLVAPLYGDKPEIGIRELLQNAVDACLERDDLIKKGILQLKDIPEDDVVVTINRFADGTASVVIEDYGVGMTSAVIDNYFLNIGASFRSSDVWRKNHESEGHSTVHRSGRFGIGVLAAFLLGKEMKVTTRHIGVAESEGCTFKCTQGEEVIEVQPCIFHHGTRIEISITQDVADKLERTPRDWDWYCIAQPPVKRVINSKTFKALPQRFTVPACDADLDSTQWRRILVDGYDDVIWSHEMIYDTYHSHQVLICNGIFVAGGRYGLDPKISPILRVLESSIPSLVVYDADGRLPLNLQRDHLAKIPKSFSKILAVDISEHFSTKLMQAFEGTTAGIHKESVSLSADPKISGLNSRSISRIPLGAMIIRQDGVLPADFHLISEAKLDSVFVDPINLAADKGAFNSPIIKSWVKNYIPVDQVSHTKISRIDFIRDSIGISRPYNRTGYFDGLPIAGRRLLLRKAEVEELIKPGSVPRVHWAKLTLERDLGTWGLWSMGNCPALDVDIRAVSAQLDNTKSFGFTIIYFDWTGATAATKESEPSPFYEAWKKVVRSAVLRQSPQ